MQRQWIVTLLVLAVLVPLLWLRRDDLGALRSLTRPELAFAGVTVLLAYLLNGCAFRVVSAPFAKLSLFEATRMQLSVYTLNYLPMKGGTVLVAAVMRQRHGVLLSQYVSLNAAAQLMSLFTFSMMGGIGVLSAGDSPLFGCLLFFGPIVGIAILQLWGHHGTPSDQITGNRLKRAVFIARDGFRALVADPKLLVQLLSINVAIMLLQTMRFYLLFRAVDAPVTPLTALAVSALGAIGHIVSVLPGGLGFREGGDVVGAVSVGITSSAGLAVAVADRAIDMALVIILGLPATVSLARVAHVKVHLDGVELDLDAVEDEPAVDVAATG